MFKVENKTIKLNYIIIQLNMISFHISLIFIFNDDRHCTEHIKLLLETNLI